MLPASVVIFILMVFLAGICRPTNLWALRSSTTALCFTILETGACWILMACDMVIELKGGYGLIQEITLIVLLLEAGFPSYLIARKITRVFQ